MRFRRLTGPVFLALGLLTFFDQLGYLNMSAVVFLALAILGGCLILSVRALSNYRTGVIAFSDPAPVRRCREIRSVLVRWGRRGGNT